MAAHHEDHAGVHAAREREVPGGEQHGAGEHEEAGVAEGELEANAQPGRSIHRSRLAVDAVADAGHGGDDPGLAEALAQARDRDAHGVRERVGVLVPRSRQQLLGADDTAFGGDEDLEHGELLPGQRDVAAVAVDLAAERIQPQACDLPHGRPVVGAPAVERPEPEHELAQLERLREVVVGAELEPGGLVVEPVGGGEHEDRHAAAGGDDALGDLVAGRPGDVAVEDGDVVGVDAQQLERGVAVAGDVCRDRLQAQAVADGLRHVGLVLDDQHTHAPMLRAGAYRRHIENRDTCRQHRAALNGGMARPDEPATGSQRPCRCVVHRRGDRGAVGSAVARVLVLDAGTRAARIGGRGARARCGRPTARPRSCEAGQSQVHAGPNQHAAPIASVAKVMTAYLVLRDHPLRLGAGRPDDHAHRRRCRRHRPPARDRRSRSCRSPPESS